MCVHVCTCVGVVGKGGEVRVEKRETHTQTHIHAHTNVECSSAQGGHAGLCCLDIGLDGVCALIVALASEAWW